MIKEVLDTEEKRDNVIERLKRNSDRFAAEEQFKAMQEEDTLIRKFKKLRPEVMEFALLMEETLKKHDLEKGDSWKTSKGSYLASELVGGFNKFFNNTDPDGSKLQLIDIANIALMLYFRL